METRQGIHSDQSSSLDTAALRREFMVEDVFKEDEITATHSLVDRIVFGGIMPATRIITLPASFGERFRAEYFLERREVGLINIGGLGWVEADGTRYELDSEDALYIGRGAREVSFGSVEPARPAKFWYVSVPAHATFASRKVSRTDAPSVIRGGPENCGRRNIISYLTPDILPTCQLLMGMTKLVDGTLWHTMPCHTHERRMELFLYFDMDADAFVVHLMGKPEESRHLMVRNEQAIIIPTWSIHSGVGTKRYALIWCMVGENQTLSDMDFVPMGTLR